MTRHAWRCSRLTPADVAAGQAWGPLFLLALFGGILVWEEVRDLPNTAYLSAWLLLLITAGAMVCARPRC